MIYGGRVASEIASFQFYSSSVTTRYSTSPSAAQEAGAKHLLAAVIRHVANAVRLKCAAPYGYYVEGYDGKMAATDAYAGNYAYRPPRKFRLVVPNGRPLRCHCAARAQNFTYCHQTDRRTPLLSQEKCHRHNRFRRAGCMHDGRYSSQHNNTGMGSADKEWSKFVFARHTLLAARFPPSLLMWAHGARPPRHGRRHAAAIRRSTEPASIRDAAGPLFRQAAGDDGRPGDD